MTPKMPISIDSLEPIALIGSGGFGQVWKAHQPSLDRTVAIKVGHTPLVDDTGRRRFEQECKALGRLSAHPGILDVYMSGVSNSGFPYLVTEYVEGGTLENASFTLTEQCLRRVGIELCQAIDAAHSSNILHRDIKPGNVFLSSEGAVVVGDFGLAKLSDDRNTTTPNVVATVAFAPPEILEGHPATTISDVYGIAVTIASAVLGSSPFISKGSNATASMVRRVLTEPPTALFGSGISPEFANLLVEAMAKDPDDRPSSAMEFKRRFEELDPSTSTIDVVRPAAVGSVDVTSKQETVESDSDLVSPVLTETAAANQSTRTPNWKLIAIASAAGAVFLGVAIVALLAASRGGGDDQISADSAAPTVPETTPATTIAAEVVAAPAEEVATGPAATGDQLPETSGPSSSEQALGPEQAAPAPSTTVKPPEESTTSTASTLPPPVVGPKATRQFQTGNRSGAVLFEPGNTSSLVHGLVDSESIHSYKFDAVRGQRLDVSFVNREGEADIRYRIFFPNGEQFIFRADGVTSKPFLAISGRYRIEVYVVNGNSGDYELNISLR